MSFRCHRCKKTYPNMEIDAMYCICDSCVRALDAIEHLVDQFTQVFPNVTRHQAEKWLRGR